MSNAMPRFEESPSLLFCHPFNQYSHNNHPLTMTRRQQPHPRSHTTPTPLPQKLIPLPTRRRCNIRLLQRRPRPTSQRPAIDTPWHLNLTLLDEFFFISDPNLPVLFLVDPCHKIEQVVVERKVVVAAAYESLT